MPYQAREVKDIFIIYVQKKERLSYKALDQSNTGWVKNFFRVNWTLLKSAISDT